MSTKLYEAFAEEAKEIDLQSLMAEMMESYNQEKGVQPNPLDELKVRKLMLARKYVEREVERLVLLKNSIMQEWDERIAKKAKEIEGIAGLIEHYIKNVNNGQKLSLDIGTATLRTSAHKVKVEDEEAAREFLQEHGVLQNYLKSPQLDIPLVQASYMNQFNAHVEQVSNQRIEAEKEANGGKITKKREKEIAKQVEEEALPSFQASLPTFLRYVPEEKKLSITMK